MAQVFVSIGSNIDREVNIRRAVEGLRDTFGDLRLSPVYESRAVGFSGDDFFNLVAAFVTDRPVEEVVGVLRSIEDRLGRDRHQPRFSSRTIDLDLLTYDQLILDTPGLKLPREELIENAFILKPMADLAGEDIHPLAGQSYAQLWRAYDAARQPLREVEFSW